MDLHVEMRIVCILGFDAGFINNRFGYPYIVHAGYCRILAGALALTFFFYVFVNVGMVSGILPVVGVPLPLISYGGTSMITLMAAFGIIMGMHRRRRLMI